MLTASHFKTLFDQYFDRIYSTFYRKTGSSETAQDLTQITFMQLWRYRDGFKLDMPEQIQIYRKANLCYIDWLRKEAHQRDLIEELKNELPQAISKSDPHLKEELEKAIASLPEKRRQVFELTYLEGYSHKEVAEQLNLSVKTVDAHVYQALQQLRKILTYISLVYFLFKH